MRPSSCLSNALCRAAAGSPVKDPLLGDVDKSRESSPRQSKGSPVQSTTDSVVSLQTSHTGQEVAVSTTWRLSHTSLPVPVVGSCCAHS